MMRCSSLFFVLFVFSLPGASLRAAPTSSQAMPVAVTVAPQAWVVERIGGDRVDVAIAVAPGESPETFQPSDADASRLLRSRIYFSIGVPSERGPWFQAIQRSRRVKVVELGSRGGEQGHRDSNHHDHGHDDHNHGSHSHGDHHHGGDEDPHIWLSPRLLAEQARIVAAALAEEDPASAAVYQDGLTRLESTLRALDEELRQRLAPHAGRAFLIYHPSWGHFAAEYGLRQLAIEIDGQSPSEVELTRLRRQAREERCEVVFVQPQVSDRIAKVVARSLGARVESLDPLAQDVAANLREAANELHRAFASLD